MKLVGHLSLVAVIHLHRDGRLCRSQICPKSIVGLIAVDENLDVMTTRELDMRQKLDRFAKKGIVDRWARCRITRRTDSMDRSTAYDVEKSNQ